MEGVDMVEVVLWAMLVVAMEVVAVDMVVDMVEHIVWVMVVEVVMVVADMEEVA